MIAVSGLTRAARRATSTPFRRGMRMSTSATSGFRVSIFASASSPSAASPITWIPWCWRISVTARSMAGWSSATRQFTGPLSADTGRLSLESRTEGLPPTGDSRNARTRMGAARQWDDIEFVASLPAAIGTADERMQRTERDLIDAALAVNDAPTLEEALSALAEAAISLTGADRISVIEWDPDYGAMTVIAGANTGLRVGTRIEVEGGPAFARGEPFVVGETHLACLPAEMAELVRRLGTVLSVPVVVEGVPPVSFQAIWESPQNEHVCDVAAAKLRLLARLTDIAFRAERERDRARQERQLRAVLEAVPHGLVVRTDRGAIVNSAARDLLATHEPPETIVLHELDGSPVDAEDTPLHRAKRTGDPQSYKMWVTRADGVQRLHEGTIGPVTDADGRVFATVTAFRDVTQEHEERFATEQFLESLFGALPTSVGVATADTGEVVSVNRAFLDLIGYELDEVLGNVHPYPWWADGMGHIPVEPGV